MGKRQVFGVKCAVVIDRGRLGAIAVLLIDALLLTTFLAPNNIQLRETFPAQASSPVTESLNFSFSLPFNRPFGTIRDDAPAKQTFYPYSVIPGGAQTVNELRNAVANDSIVRAHYADFVVANTRVERIEKTQAFYVSYRIGNNVFWTKNALVIPAGETVLSDGANMARTRCGNRLSLAPITPVSKAEPAPEAMEIASGGVLLASVETPAELPIAPAPTTAIATPPTTPASPPIGIFLPLPPFFPIDTGGTPLPPGIPVAPTPPSGPPPPSGPIPPTAPPSGPTPPPVAAPEPSALLMLALGLGCILLVKKLEWISRHYLRLIPARLLRPFH